jgi:hypothetical protein
MPEPVYPNVWGAGQLFAFSGVDGETDWAHPFVASTLADEVGLLFHTRVPRRLVCEPVAVVVEKLLPRVVAGDCIDFTVRCEGGRTFPLRFLFCDGYSVVGETSIEMPPRVEAEGSAAVSTGADVTVHSSREEYTALAWKHFGDKVVFGFALSMESASEAIDRARATLSTNIPALLARRLLFFSTLPGLKDAPARRRRAASKAFSILKTNVESPQGLLCPRWSTPDRWPHRDLWLWDSCFHSFGYRVFSPDLAAETLRAVLSAQREDGFLPHQASPVHTSDITQPPLLAWAFLELFKQTKDRGLLDEAYPQLVKFVEWVLANRDRNGNGLLEWKITGDPLCRSGESGMDNSPRFDAGVELDCVDFTAYVVNELQCLGEAALALGNVSDARRWRKVAERTSEAVNSLLWDERDGFYYDRTLDGELVKLKCASGFLPMFAGIPSKEQARRLVRRLQDPDEFWTTFPVPTVARSEQSYERDGWRGPTWLNIDFLIVLGLRRYGCDDLAGELTAKVLSNVEHWYARLGSIYEFYDPDGGVPPPDLDRKKRLSRGEGIAPVADYNWSAACYLALVTGTV